MAKGRSSSAAGDKPAAGSPTPTNANAEQAEADRVAAEQAEAERVAAEQAEADRVAAEQAEADRVAAEHAQSELAEHGGFDMAGRTIMVRSVSKAGRRRAGIAFGPEATPVEVDDLTEDQLAAILGDSDHLIVQLEA